MPEVESAAESEEVKEPDTDREPYRGGREPPWDTTMEEERPEDDLDAVLDDEWGSGDEFQITDQVDHMPREELQPTRSRRSRRLQPEEPQPTRSRRSRRSQPEEPPDDPWMPPHKFKGPRATVLNRDVDLALCRPPMVEPREGFADPRYFCCNLDEKKESERRIYLGEMSLKCDGCGALHFVAEARDADFDEDHRELWNRCCNFGRVTLPPPRKFPDHMDAYCRRDKDGHKDYHKNICTLNSQLSFVSIGGGALHPDLDPGRHCMRIGGLTTHYLNNVEPDGIESTLQGAELYLLDPESRGKILTDRFEPINPNVSGPVTEEVELHHPMAKALFCARDLLKDIRDKKLTDNFRGVLLKEGGVPHDVVGPERVQFDLPQSTKEVFLWSAGTELPRDGTLAIHLRPEPGKTSPYIRRQRISFLSPDLDSGLFPLMFPHGEQTYIMKTPKNVVRGLRRSKANKNKSTNNKETISMREYYAYMFQVRRDIDDGKDFGYILRGGNLTQLMMCISYLRVELERMYWALRNQGKFVLTSIHHINEFLRAEAQKRKLGVGRVFLLPTNHIGSPAYLVKQRKKAMAMLGRFGKPDWFLTVTCNPGWKEIQSNLLPGQTYLDRPDLCVHVFMLKVRELLQMLKMEHLLGKLEAYFLTYEFQKRYSLIHLHVLLWNFLFAKPQDAKDIDALIQAFIPDPTKYPELFDIVTSTMLHQLCHEIRKASCHRNNKCRMGYPAPLRDDTLLMGPSGRCEYRRPRNGIKVMKAGKIYDNRNVAAYNPIILLRMWSHVNILHVNSIRVVFYLLDYMLKGMDKLVVREHLVRQPDPDEVLPEQGNVQKEAEDARRHAAEAEATGNELPEGLMRQSVVCVPSSDPEKSATLDYDEVHCVRSGTVATGSLAMFRLSGYNFHYYSHKLVVLCCHGPGEHIVMAEIGNEGSAKPACCCTLQLAMDTFNRDERTRGMTYVELHENYILDQKTKQMKPRKQQDAKIIVMLDPVCTMREQERFHLYLLLRHVLGFTSFEALRTVNGFLCESFKEACLKLRLLDDDAEAIEVLNQAKKRCRPKTMRRLFANLLRFGAVNEPERVFMDFLQALTLDRRHLTKDDDKRDYVLASLAHYFEREDLSRPALFNMLKNFDLAKYTEAHAPQAVEMMQEDAPDEGTTSEEQPLEEYLSNVNAEQRNVFDDVVKVLQQVDPVTKRVPANVNSVFWVNGSGGTGKTYTYQAILAWCSANNRKAVVSAPTGIAAQLLPNGTTCHYCFGLPFDLYGEASSSLKKESIRGQALGEADLILIDEVSMLDQQQLSVISKVLCTMGAEPVALCVPFGRKVILLGGDFAQLAPFCMGECADNNMLRSPLYSTLWGTVRGYTLSKNMRAIDDIKYSEYIGAMGRGELPGCVDDRDTVRVPGAVLLGDLEESGEDLFSFFMRTVFENDLNTHARKRVILTPRNCDVDELNDQFVRAAAKASEVDIMEAIAVHKPGANCKETQETMAATRASGLPPAVLRLCPGALVAITRNLCVPQGLVNGARLQVISCTQEFVHATMLEGRFAGTDHFIFRVANMHGKPERFDFFNRVQFPLCLSYSMTVNKAQGRTIERLGIYMAITAFAHGMLYVALSRARKQQDVVMVLDEKQRSQGLRTFLLPDGGDSVVDTATRNVVWRRLIDKADSSVRKQSAQGMFDDSVNSIIITISKIHALRRTSR